MSIGITTLEVRWPYLYHLTASGNLPRIRRERQLDSASKLFRASGQSSLLRTRRKEHIEIQIGSDRILVRDQAPLHEGNLILEGGLTFQDFLAALNRQVFFWPGSVSGPISYGVRHFERYRGEAVHILRVPTADIAQANPAREPLVCRYNSGSPRWSRGRPSPRGADTFIAISMTDLAVGKVVEVTFAPDVRLPASTQVSTSPAAGWRAFF